MDVSSEQTLEDGMGSHPGPMLQEHYVYNIPASLIARTLSSAGHQRHEWKARLSKVARGWKSVKKSWKVQTELTAAGTAKVCDHCSCLCLLLVVVRVLVPVLLAFVSV